MIITISGPPGSGKTSIAKELANRLKYDRISIGEIVRQHLGKRSLPEVMADAPAWDAVQEKVERYLDTLHTKKNTVIDGRDAFFHIPISFKILLTVPVLTAAKRIHAEKRTTEHFANVEETARELRARTRQERALYKTLHGINYLDKKQFDLVIDTGTKTITEIVEQILSKLP